MIAAALAHHAERLKNKGVRAPSRVSAERPADVREDFSDVFDALRGSEDIEEPADDWDDDWASDLDMGDF